MKPWEVLKNRPWLISFVLVVGLGVTGFAYQNSQADEREHQICESQVETRLVIRDIIDYIGTSSVASAPDPTQELPEPFASFIRESRETSSKRAAEFRDFVVDRLEIPPEICKDIGVDIGQIIEDRPIQEFLTTTTTTGGQ